MICNNVNIPNATALHGASLVAQTVKDPPAIQEDRVQSLGWEDPLKHVVTYDLCQTYGIQNSKIINCVVQLPSCTSPQPSPAKKKKKKKLKVPG